MSARNLRPTDAVSASYNRAASPDAKTRLRGDKLPLNLKKVWMPKWNRHFPKTYFVPEAFKSHPFSAIFFSCVRSRNCLLFRLAISAAGRNPDWTGHASQGRCGSVASSSARLYPRSATACCSMPLGRYSRLCLLLLSAPLRSCESFGLFFSGCKGIGGWAGAILGCGNKMQT